MSLDEAMAKAVEHLESQADPAPEAEPAPAETPEAPAAESAPAEVKPDRVRDESGKFTKAPKAKPAQKASKEPAAAAPQGDVHGAARAAPPAGQGPADGAAAPTSPAAPSAAPDSPALKLPQSWKPAAREALAKAPREVQEEAIRIDREVRQVLQQSAEARKTAETVHRTLAPFEGLARANGMDAMSYAGSVLQTAAALQMGAPAQRAGIIASLINTYGVELEAINQHLANPQAAVRQQPQHVDPRAEVRRILDEERAQAEQQANQRAVEEFIASPPEFFEDVKADLPDILRLDRQRGGNMTLQQAYDRACKLSETVQAKLAKKKESERVRTATAATQAAQAATQVSLRSTPAAPVRAKPKGLDAALNAARDKLGM